MEVYHRPANRFVAGFIGSPAMNFVTGSLRGDGVFDGGALVLTLNDTQRAALDAAGVSAGPATLGIRPQSLARADGEGHVAGTVEVSERMGAETFVHVEVGSDEPLVARLQGDVPLSVGETVSLSADPAHIHLFTADGTNALVSVVAP